MSQLRTVRLYGKLGARFGRVHRFHLESNTVAEAIAALDSQFAGFRAFMVNAKQHGMVFAVFAGKRNLAVDDMTVPTGSDDIRIAPVIAGSKNGGLFNIILGGALIALSFVPGLQFAAPYLLNAGIMLIAGGVAQMLSPQPKSKVSNGSNEPSYVFNGAVNTEAQGHPVPLLYGRMIVGSAVISAGIEASDYSPSTTGVTPGTPNWKPTNPYEVAP